MTGGEIQKIREMFAAHGLEYLIRGGEEMPPCKLKRGGMCALTNDRCNWARCPYTPRTNITVEVKTPDGRIDRRTLHPTGSISDSYYQNEEEKRASEEIEKPIRQIFESLGYGANCVVCGRPITPDEAMSSQGNHCARCWDHEMEDLSKETKGLS